MSGIYNDEELGIIKLPKISARPGSSSSEDDERFSQSRGRTHIMSPTTDQTETYSSKRVRRRMSKQSTRQSPTVDNEKQLPGLKTFTTYAIISDDMYNEKKERLLKQSKLKNELRKYFDVDAKVGIVKVEDSDDEAYDTDLETVGIDLIVHEKTEQLKKDGVFPEYKRHCRNLKIVPNSFLIRNAMEDDFIMRHRYMNLSDCLAMAEEIENNLTFKAIDLQDNGLTHKHLQKLSNMLIRNNYLTEINISCNPIGEGGPKILKKILQSNSHITKAEFSDCCLGDKAGEYLAETIENNVYLRELNLRRNNLGNETARHIGNSLGTNITLEVLDLSWNHIGKQGAVFLASGLKVNSQLIKLNVAMNGFGEEGGIAIFEALRNQDSLEELDISANRLTDNVARVLSTIIPYNRHLKTLKISYNLITAVGALTLLKPYSSRMKKRLTTVELQGIDVDAELVDAVNMLQTKRGMTVVISRPPSRREKTTDQLTFNLISVVELLSEYDMDVYDVFPEFELEKEEMITSDDIIQAMKKSDKITDKRKIQSLKRSIRETKGRNFQMKEFAVLYTQVLRGSDPTVEEPLRSVFAGRKRASTPSTVKKERPKSRNQGVRFL